MKTDKKNNAVVFGLTADHTFAVACVMQDLKKVSPNLVDEVVIIHDGIKDNDKKILESILPCRFIIYDFPLKSHRVLEAKSVQHFTKMVFTKFECLSLLQYYKNVVWMDYDIVIKSDISELFLHSDIGIKMMPGGLTVRGQLLKDVSDYNMTSEGICSSLLVFQDHLKCYMEMYNFCYDSLEKYAPVLYMPEQAIFDFMIQQFKLSPIPLNRNIYSPHPTDLINARSAKIIHSYGQTKFWNGINDKQWNKNYDFWLSLGGTPYKHVTFIKKIINKFCKIYRRNKLF